MVIVLLKSIIIYICSEEEKTVGKNRTNKIGVPAYENSIATQHTINDFNGRRIGRKKLGLENRSGK